MGTGRWRGGPLVERHAGPRERAALRAAEGRWGLASLALFRAVPVLSEASGLAAEQSPGLLAVGALVVPAVAGRAGRSRGVAPRWPHDD